MGNEAPDCDVVRLVRETRAYLDFIRLVPPPPDEEEAWAIGDLRDVIANAAFAYSLIALRRLDDFLCDRRKHPDDVIAEDRGVDLNLVLGEANSVLTPREREQVNKTTAHFTHRGLTDDMEYDEHWIDVFERNSEIMDRLLAAVQASKIEDNDKCSF